MINTSAKEHRIKFAVGAIFVVVSSLVAYLFTLCPTIYVGDSGELIAASWTMGVPHSPGYPLYTFIGYFFSHAPFGDNPAVRINFMTALFGVASAVVLYYISVILSRDYALSTLASLIFAFSRTVWSQSVTAEVYTLNNLVVALAITFILITSMNERRHFLYLAAYFAGLAITTHQTSILILPASIWLFVKTGKLPLKKGFKHWLITAIFFVLGLAFYIYLPIAASKSPAMNWGNPSTLNNFVRTLFSPAFTQINYGNFIDHFFYLFEMLFREFNFLGSIVVIIGFIVAFSKGSSIQYRLISWIVLTYTLFFLFTLRPVSINLYKLDVYYLPVFMLLSALIPLGIKAITEIINGKIHISQTVIKPVMLAIVFVAALWNLFGNYDINNRRDNRLAEWYGKELLESCTDNSIMLCNFDDLFILFYMQKVLGYRDDVTVVLAHFPRRGENAFWKDWIYEELLDDVNIKTSNAESMFYKSGTVEQIIEAFIDENIDSHDVFFSFYRTPPLEMKKMDYRFEPHRFCYRVSKMGQDIEILLKNFAYMKTEYGEEYFAELFRKHHNVEEDFILVRCDELFRFNAALFNELSMRQEALYLMNLATAVNPYSADNWIFKSRIEESLGLIDESIGSIDKIIEFQSRVMRDATSFDILDWRYEQARIYHRAGKDLEAATILNDFYHLDSRRPPEVQRLAKEIEKALAESNDSD